MNLEEYRNSDDRNAFWRMYQGDVLNFLDEAIETIDELKDSFSPYTIEQVKAFVDACMREGTFPKAPCDGCDKLFSADQLTEHHGLTIGMKNGLCSECYADFCERFNSKRRPSS